MAGRFHLYPDPENPNQPGWWLQPTADSPSPVAQAPPPTPAPAITFGIDPRILGPQGHGLPPPLPPFAPPPPPPPQAPPLPPALSGRPTPNRIFRPSHIENVAQITLMMGTTLEAEQLVRAYRVLVPRYNTCYGSDFDETGRAAKNFKDRWSQTPGLGRHPFAHQLQFQRVVAGSPDEAEMRRVLAHFGANTCVLTHIGRHYSGLAPRATAGVGSYAAR